MRTTSMQIIVGIRRLEETLQRSEGSGDNWHMTWARDDKQYVVLGDGKVGQTRKVALDQHTTPGYTASKDTRRISPLSTCMVIPT